MIKVIVNGACGRMGSTVVDAVMKDSELKLVGAVDIVGGMDAGDKAGCGKTGVIVSTDLQCFQFTLHRIRIAVVGRIVRILVSIQKDRSRNSFIFITSRRVGFQFPDIRPGKFL